MGKSGAETTEACILPFLSRPNRKITERSYSATTLMQVHSEKGSVTITKSKASPVKTIAQNPGPSGSAEKENIKCDNIHIKLS